MTRDFAMAAYSYEDASLEADLTVSAPMIVSASASLWGTWHTQYSPHTNYGPQECTPPTPEQAMDISSLRSAEPGVIPSAFNQCVFIRYYTMRSRGPLGLFPKVIRAGAGPHDLGPGDNTGGDFPELAVQPDVEPTENTDVELDVVIRNIPDVCFLPCPFLRSKFCLQDKEFDGWHPVADYVFQVILFPPCHCQDTQPSRWKNSNATSVLLHHQDLAGIRAVGSTNMVGFGFSPLGRRACMISRSYWPRINHRLLWTRMEVSLCVNWIVWV